MGGNFLESREEIFGLLAGDLQPEGVGAKVDFAGPLERPPLVRDAGMPKYGIIVPGGKHALASVRGEIGFAFPMQLYAGREVGVVDYEVVVGEASCSGYASLGGDFHAFEEFMRGRIAERRGMFKDEQRLWGHRAARGGAIVILSLIHI